MRILIVDAHPKRCETLKRVLEQNFFMVDWHCDLVGARFVSNIDTYHLVIIDAEIPPVGAQNLCRQIRDARRDFPILVIGPSEEPAEVAACLNEGADDYIQRPFPIVEIIARIRALLRRPPLVRKRSVQIQDLRIDLNSRLVYRGKKEIHLTRIEYIILEFLAERDGEILTNEAITEHIWGQNPNVGPHAVETHIFTLRGKIDKRAKSRLIQNIRGRGYRLA
jgi:two-component system OmpR family response regulator